MTKFKNGDNVRVVCAEGIVPNSARFKNGEIGIVSNASSDGIWITRESDGGGICVADHEFYCVELVSQKPTKKQRIKALESEVAELKAKVEALEKSQAKPKVIPVTTDNIEVGDKIRVIDKDGIGPAVLTNGKVYEVEWRDTDGDFYVTDDEGDRMSIVSSEFHAIEKVVSV